jgi:hypothetical protein
MNELLQQKLMTFLGGFIAGAVVCGIVAAMISSGMFSQDPDPAVSVEEMVAHIKGDQVAEVRLDGDDLRLIYWTGKMARVDDARNASIALIIEAAMGTKTKITESPSTPGILWTLIVSVLPLLLAAAILAGAAALAGYAFGRGFKKS